MGLDYNFVSYGANGATDNPLHGSFTFGYTFVGATHHNRLRYEFGVQRIKYVSQFKWISYGSHGFSPPEEVIVRFRWTTLTFPALIGFQSTNFYACIGPGLSWPIYYSNSLPYGSNSGHFYLLVPSGSLMINTGAQFVLFYHKFSLELQSSLLPYKYAEGYKSFSVGYLNAGFALKFNFIKEKIKTII